MSNKNFMAYGDAETVLTGFANDIKTKASEAGTESLINSTVGWTGKNQCNSENLSTTTGGGTLTAVRNADGSITFNGTNGSGNSYFLIDTIPVNMGSYKLNGCADGGGANTFQLYVQIDNTSQGRIQGTCYTSSDDVEITNPDNNKTANVQFVARANASFDNVTIYPMIRDSRITDPTYEPYHKSVEEELSAIHSIPSGGTAGQVLSKASGTDYDLEWANMAGGAKVHTWETTTTDQTDMWLVLTLTSTPVLAVGDIYVIKVKADYVGYDFQSYGTTTYGIRFTNGGSTVSWTNCISAGVDGSGNDVPFTPDIHEGDVITLLCTNASTPKFLLLSSNKDKEYCEATITLSTSATTTATFYNAGITSDSVLEVGVSEWGLIPDSVSMSSTGIATAVFPAVDSARSVTVRLYIK